jgi:hypothetical protein
MTEGLVGARRTGPGCVLAFSIFTLAAALGLSACGGGSPSPGSTSMAGSYVTAKSLRRYKPGTPQRTVLQWWKAVQFGDPTIVHTYYAPGVGPRIPVLQHELALASTQFTGVPTFNSAEIHGNAATLYFFTARPGSSAPPRAVSVNLVETGGKWVLADDELLAQVVERVKSASRRPNG